MPKVLTIDEFAKLLNQWHPWHRWHEIGTQPEWRRRFQRGSRASMQPFSNAIRDALIRPEGQVDDQLANAA